MHQYSFEKLDIWKLSIKLACQIYQLTETLPNDEKYGLSSQLKRASSSISSRVYIKIHCFNFFHSFTL